MCEIFCSCLNVSVAWLDRAEQLKMDRWRTEEACAGMVLPAGWVTIYWVVCNFSFRV